MIGTIAGFFGREAKREQARMARMIGEYNAKVAEIQAEGEAQAVEYQTTRLIKSQREAAAQQRMSISGRGGLSSGTDLLSLIESAKNMQMDVLEMKRQEDIAIISGKTKAQQIKMGAKAESDRLKAEGTQALLGGIQSDIMMMLSMGK